VAVEEQESDEPEGDVISQSPGAGAEVARGETVTITVSTGRPQVQVPDVIGMGEARATARISSAGLTPVREERAVTDPTQDGVVVDQRPGGGTEIDEGGQVVIVVGVLKQDDTLQPAPPASP
jgi:eukaryotic-like serine/threonine-protein kinase